MRTVIRCWLLVTCVLSLAILGLSFQSDEFEDPVEDTAQRRSIHEDNLSSQRTQAGLNVNGGDRQLQFPLLHSLSFDKSAQFVQAGEFSARLRTSTSQRTQRVTRLRLQRRPFSAEEREAFKVLVQKDGLYRVRVPATVTGSSNGTVLAALPARCLAAANLEEHFDLHLDWLGNVVAVTYGTPEGCSRTSVQELKDWDFVSSAAVKMPLQAPRLSAAGAVLSTESIQPGGPKKKAPSANREKGTGKDGEEEEVVEEEKSFFAKYWMYIIPGVFMLLQLMAAGAPPEGPPGGGPQRQPGLASGQRAVRR